MSLSPVANRSFLHGDRKLSPTSEKIVYATLDSLALKRARLPLQLLPVDGDHAAATTSKIKKKKSGCVGSTTRNSSPKVEASKDPAKYLLVVPSDERRSKGVEIQSNLIEEQHSEKGHAHSDSSVASTSMQIEEKDVSWSGNREMTSSRSGLEDYGLSSDPVEAKCSSDDYEKIELMPCTETFPTALERTTEANEESLEDEETLYPDEEFLISTSVSNLTRKSSSSPRLENGTSSIETFSADGLTGDSPLGNEVRSIGKKKKNRFAKNVLHFVPDYLVKGPRGTKKKKKGYLSSSLSSLKPSSVDPKTTTNSSRSRSLSREELKLVKISSPTNFVHVASATNPSLVLNENTDGFGVEQVVITHEQKCATLPLLVAGNEDSTTDGQFDRRGSFVTERMFHLETSIPGKANEQAARKDKPAFDDSSLKRELLSELQARSAKTLEHSQQVKTNGNQIDAREGKLYESLCQLSLPLPLSRAELRANSSFLWSSQAKNLAESTREEWPRATAIESAEVADEESYDDVGPLNAIGQEDVYDDVGSPTVPIEENCSTETTSEDCDSIYDDVTTPCNTGNYSPVRSEKAEGLNFTDDEPALRRNSVGTNSGSSSSSSSSSSTEIHGEELDQENDDYLLIGNEYSSVDEEDTDEMQDNEQGVYDDVGLPGEERVNSLYAGSATGSISGVTVTNGMESEWEDLDSSASGLPSLAREINLSTEIQVVSRTKVSGEKSSRKVKRQRSRVSRKSLKSSIEPMPRDATIYVAVSLGSGSVLLVGCTEKIEQWSREETDDRATDENSQRTQGLVQMRVIDLDEDMDTQETSCYIYEDNTSDDSTYESLHSFQPDDFSTDDSETETETIDPRNRGVGGCTVDKIPNRTVNTYLEAPTKPTPPPPREGSLTQTLGRRIKLLRRTWSFTKGSLGRIRRRTSVDDEHSCEENKETCNDHHQNYEGGRYFGFARHFKKSVTGLSTFYLNGYTTNGSSDSTSTGNNDRSNKEPMYSNISVNKEADHYSVLADQEPLYQFYAAAAARVAFDSNSDGYEEVEDMTPSQSTTDLAKPGHRTLWCQTPQVLHAGLLERLSAEERKIQEAKFEILTSEASYLNSLRVLENEFLNEPSINEILTPAEKDKLFGGIPSVLHASEQFLAELETVWRRDPMLHGLSDVLIKYADKCLDIYVAYCSNQVTIDTSLKDLRTRRGLKFLETVSQIEARPTCQSLTLHSFLMLPMQRITRLPLLADAILSKLPVEHTDRSDWEKVLSSLSYVVAECNEGARAAAKEAEMESLARKLEYSVKIKPIVLKGKYLVKSGTVVQLVTKADTEYKLTFGKKFNKAPLYLLLLTDYLLVAKFKSSSHDETYTVIDTCKRSLIALESVPEDSPFAGRNAMLLTLLENYSGRQVEYILTCESNTERQRWLEAVSPSIRGLVEETLYEAWDCPQVVALYSYSPNQSDELSLHPGDVINVLRKMSDGWFHGEKLLDGDQGWFPGNYTKEVASEHVRARNLKQRHRLLTLSGSVLQRKAKQQSAIC